MQICKIMALFEIFGRFFHRKPDVQESINTQIEFQTDTKQKRRSFLLNRRSVDLEGSWELIEAYNTNIEHKKHEENHEEEHTDGKSKFFVQKKIEFFENMSNDNIRKRSHIKSRSAKTERTIQRQPLIDRANTFHLSKMTPTQQTEFENILQKQNEERRPKKRFSFNFHKSTKHWEPKARAKSEPPNVSVISLNVNKSSNGGNSMFYIQQNQTANKVENTHENLSFKGSLRKPIIDNSDSEDFLIPIDSSSTNIHIGTDDKLEDKSINNNNNNENEIENLNLTFVKQSLQVQKLHQQHKRSNSENKAIFACSYLSEREAKQIKKIYHTRTFSIPNLLNDDTINGEVVTQQHMAVMESLRIRKVRQKIAQRMVKVNALNNRRPRTDVGQPLNNRRPRTDVGQPLGKTWSFNDQDSDTDVSVLRTASDPEFIHERSGASDDDSLVTNEELPNGDFQPLETKPQVDEIPQQPVQSLITMLNRNLSKESENADSKSKPIPAPRRIKTEKPIPSPRPLTKSYSLEDISNIRPETEPIRFIPPKPKTRPKPSILTDGSLDKGIFKNASNKDNKKPAVGKLIDLSDDEKLNDKENKETNNDTSNSYDGSAYEVVDLKMRQQVEEYEVTLVPGFNSSVKYTKDHIKLPVPLSPLLPPTSKRPTSPPLKPPTSPIQYMDMDGTQTEEESYLSPVDATSPLSSPQNENVPPLKNTNKPQNKTQKKKDSSNFTSNKSKISKFKFKGKSLSVASQKESTFHDEIRRGSAPNILMSNEDDDIAYEDMGPVKRASSPCIYEPLYDNVEIDESVSIHNTSQNEDNEGWASDEFDEDEESDEDGNYAEISVEEAKPIPKLELEGASKKLYNIATEILTTERAYVKRLHLLDRIFQKELSELSKEDGSFTEKTISDIFANLSQIYQFHSEFFLPKIEERIYNWTNDNRIGDIFVKLGSFFKLYTVFVQNFDNSTNTINQCMKKNQKFAECVQKIQKYPECENLSLQHHMLEPIQRVPRYKLLLNDYINKLPLDSPDRNDAEDSLKKVSQIAQEANNSMKENEKFKKLLEIEERISEGLKGESLVTASRIFLKEGVLKKLASRKNTSADSTVLLFSDVLLYCSINTVGKLRVRRIMDLDGLVIEHDETLPELAFRIRTRQKVLDLLPSNQTEKDDWIESINKAVAEWNKKRGSRIKRAMEEFDCKHGVEMPGKTAPVWVKDEDVTMCMLCAAKFGLIHRKHHCRGCGRVTCNSCSKYQAPLEYMNNAKTRVCFACSEKLGLQVKTSIEDDVSDNINVRPNLEFEICGEMFWKPPGKNWSKEWIYLNKFILYIQRKRQDLMARSTLPVVGFTVGQPTSVDEMETSHPYCIKLHKDNKKDFTYYISSENQQLIDRWKKHLSCAVIMDVYSETNE